MKKEIFYGTSLMWCVIILSTIYLGCNDKEISEIQHWKLGVNHGFIEPIYFEDCYIIHSLIKEDSLLVTTRIDEFDGSIISVLDTLKLPSLPNLKSTNSFVRNSKLLLSLDKYIYQLDLKSGKLLSIDTLDNYVWRLNDKDELISGCSFTDTSFQYFELSISDDQIESKIILDTTFVRTEKKLNGGLAPIRLNGSWVLPYFEGDKTSGHVENSLLIVPDNGKLKSKIYESNMEGSIPSNSPKVSEDQIFLTLSNSLISLNTYSFEKNWLLELDHGSNNLYQSDENLYLVPSVSIEKGNFMYIIDKNTGVYTTIESPAMLSYGIPMNDVLSYVGSGEYKEFDMKTHSFREIDLKIKSRSGFQPIFSMSNKSVLLWDVYGWKCYPRN